jgi:hypothetical protein
MFRRRERKADIARTRRHAPGPSLGWYQQWREGGLESLKKAERAGRPRGERSRAPQARSWSWIRYRGLRSQGVASISLSR